MAPSDSLQAEKATGAVTRVLHEIENGDSLASEDLLPLVYEELRSLARIRLAKEKPGLTLQATALVHEAYLRLLGSCGSSWKHRGHFFAAAAEAMRRILLETARRKRTAKHGDGFQRVGLHHVEGEKDDGVDLLELDDALERLADKSPRKGEVVKLRYFAGLTIEEVASVLEVSTTTVTKDWLFAKTWLARELD